MKQRIHGAWLVALAVAATFAISARAHAQGTTAQRTTTVAAKKGRSASDGNDRMRGVMLGVHSMAAPGLTINGGGFDEALKTESGTGAGFTIGYGFNSRISSYFSLDVARQRTVNEDVGGEFGLGHLEFGIRGTLPLSNMPSTVPYVTASLGRRALGAHGTDEELGEADVAFHGRMYGIGAGVEHFFSPTMSIDGGVQLAFGKFDHLKVESQDLDLQVNGTRSMRLRLGVNWRP